MKSLFISDLHLHPDHPEGIRIFEDFISEHAKQADRLFILGDLFEYWLGDDAVEFSGYKPVMDALSSLSCLNTKILFMHGNRDFLVSKDFASACSGWLLPDPSVFDLDGQKILLSHGDLLCTDDHEHQAFREQTRDKSWQNSLLDQSLEQRDALAKQLRMGSEEGKQIKPESIMDVSQSTVEQQMLVHDVRLLIHGHTHRPAIHDFTLDGQLAHRIVLGDWYESGSFLSHKNGEFQLMSYPDNTVQAQLQLVAG
ncbi:MAG TPA: UDP-2,3-diacylglucosamine diphosphatase [Gammaproteobacteria bacterium]|nr:UDP-2,3-diacylglucosamine diphosphatase [Gammaproteobacteria bacterium]